MLGHPTFLRLATSLATRDVRVIRALPPHFVACLPDCGSFDPILPQIAAGSNRKIDFLVRINEHKADIVLGCDFISLRAAQISQEPDHAASSIGPCLQWPAPQSFGAPRGEHAYTDALDNSSDAVETIVIRHP